MLQIGVVMPEMSIVLVTPDTSRTIQKTIDFLRRQSVKDKLELVIVAPDRHKVVLDKDTVADFASVTVVSVGPMQSVSAARAMGVHASQAPIIAFTEEHCFPEPDWAEILIRSHRHSWAVVGPAVKNANPNSLTSRANLAIEYGPWIDPVSCGLTFHLPGHNSSYKRRILDKYAPRVAEWLDAESVLHWDLLSKGYFLYLESSAKIRHWNFSRLSHSIALRFYHGRLFAGARGKKWPAHRRTAYCIGGPLIPVVRLYRVLRELRRPDRQGGAFFSLIPVLILLLIFDAFGEMVGYVSGFGNALERIRDMEFHREHYLTSTDRQEFLTEHP